MCIVTVKNLTSAMRCRDILLSNDIDCEIVSVDPALTKRGCSYGVSFPCRSENRVRRILSSKKADYGEIMGFPTRSGWYN